MTRATFGGRATDENAAVSKARKSAAVVIGKARERIDCSTRIAGGKKKWKEEQTPQGFAGT
jgi:hypothetical protein